VPSAGLRILEDEPATAFVHEAAFGLADLDLEDLAGENLTLRLCLSLWMHRGGVSIDTARNALLLLRSAIIASAGLDERTEPVPLLVADPVSAALSLVYYLDSLLRRAAYAAEMPRVEVAARTVARLAG
jgi:hypothetical protein